MPKQLGWEQKGTGAQALEVAPGWVWTPTPNHLSHHSFLKYKLCLQDGHGSCSNKIISLRSSQCIATILILFSVVAWF